MSGSLCSDLCEHNKIQLGQCLSAVPEKQICEAEWEVKEVVLKINVTWFKEFAIRQEVKDSDAAAMYMNDVSARARTMFGDCSQCHKLTSALAILGDGNSDGIVTGTEAKTFISLLQFIEPLMLIALNDSKHTVDFYGYCGGLYAVEKVPLIASEIFGTTWELLELPGNMLEPLQVTFNYYVGKIVHAAAFYAHYADTLLNRTFSLNDYPIFANFFSIHFPSRREKFQFAYSLLDTIVSLSEHPYGLVQQCDGHLGNFGITSNASVKIIDLDLLFPYFYIKDHLERNECLSDEVCWVGNNRFCLSTCDSSKGFCSSDMLYQDLHVVCEGFLPQIFGDSGTVEAKKHDNTALRRAIEGLGSYCNKLPSVYSSREMRLRILNVKKKLRSIENKLTTCTENCQL